MVARAGVDPPVAAVEGVSTATPVVYQIHFDHLGRPIRMTEKSGTVYLLSNWQMETMGEMSIPPPAFPPQPIESHHQRLAGYHAG